MKREILTYELAVERFEYDPATGVITNRISGKPTGKPNEKGYLRIEVKIGPRRMKVMAHHLAWLLVTGSWPEEQVDHRNNDRGDNRWVNLRAATHGQNQLNKRPIGAVPVKGVTRRKNGRYQVRISLGGERVYLGTYDTEEAAEAAYQAMAASMHGEFAYQGGEING